MAGSGPRLKNAGGGLSRPAGHLIPLQRRIVAALFSEASDLRGEEHSPPLRMQLLENAS